MAGFRFADIFADCESLANLTGSRAMVRRLVIEAIGAIASEHEWPELWDEDFFTTVAEYATGTVTATNGSTTITGASTVFTSAMVGRKIRIGSDNAYYDIAAFVSTTELTLSQPYQGTTASGSSYSIYQDRFRLRGDVDQAKLLRQIENGVALVSVHPSDLDMLASTPNVMGPAWFQVMVGTRQDTYSTGTVSMLSGSRTITGTSTAWTTPQGLSRGIKIQIGTALFTVRSVDSATQITTYEAATATVSGSTYVALLWNIVYQLFSIPNTQENYYYRFQRIPAIPDADQDVPDLPSYLHPLIKPYVLQFLYEFKGFVDRKTSAQATYDRMLATAIRNHGFANPDQVYQRKSSDGAGRPMWRLNTRGLILR